MICFHFTIFVVLTTTRPRWRVRLRRLWFAFILLSLSYWQQPKKARYALTVVVICFHFTIFVVLTTTVAGVDADVRRLWFAFILLSLSYWQQQEATLEPLYFGCDLLSFYYLCRTDNNTIFLQRRFRQLWFAFILLSLSYWQQPKKARYALTVVVICFHFTIFVVLTTTVLQL